MKTTILLIVTLLLLSSAAQAKFVQSNAENQGSGEVIEIVGERPLEYYFKLRNKKRFAFMATFNQHIQDKDLAFDCRKQLPTGSHIPAKVCKNAFDWRIQQEITEFEVSRGNMTQATWIASLGNSEQKQRKQDLIQAIQSLLEENANLKQAYLEFKRTDEAFQAAHARQFGALSPYSMQ